MLSSVSLLANLPEDKLSKMVDCLEVVSRPIKPQRTRLRNILAAQGSRTAADSCCQNIISIGPYTVTARQQVPPVRGLETKGADIIPVITGCCILLPELFDRGPRKCLFKWGTSDVLKMCR